MTKIAAKTARVVVLLLTVVAAMASATRFAASLALAGDGPQPDAKPPAVPTATGSAGQTAEVEARATETKALSWAFRNRREFHADGYEDAYIGGLVKNGAWSDSLPLGRTQASAITKLDDLLRDAADRAALAAAEYMDTNPPDYQAYNARLYRRLSETRPHGQRMVSLGLLTEPQAALVMQRYLSGSNRLYVLRDKNVQDLLGITASQNKELDKVGRDANRREARLNLWTVDPKEQQYVREQMAANAKQMEDEAIRVLTPSQREMLSRLAAARSLPAKPPDLPALSAAEAARSKIEDLSPLFRVLAEKADAFALSDPQKKLLNRLEEVTRDGLFWISRRNSQDAAPPADAGKVRADRGPSASAEFVKQAELVALFGILTEKQAEQVQSAIK